MYVCMYICISVCMYVGRYAVGLCVLCHVDVPVGESSHFFKGTFPFYFVTGNKGKQKG